uniref:Uncharacterized protein LOC102808880 n=1 Tax=Saccoglossus kowalevskii TaxID=10224 RepID=A0ABM0MJR0_SACKO|nr:PREDICTED: uncharacterized protein LOC102808880 [Saccoglossus kowalevskii]
MEVQTVDDDVICLSDDDCDESIIFIEEVSGTSKKQWDDPIKSKMKPVTPIETLKQNTPSCSLHNRKMTMMPSHDLVVEVGNTSKQHSVQCMGVPTSMKQTSSIEQTHSFPLHKNMVTKSPVHNLMEVDNTSKSANQLSLVTQTKTRLVHSESNMESSSQHSNNTLIETNKSFIQNAELEICVPGSLKKRSVKVKNNPPSSEKVLCSFNESSLVTELSSKLSVQTVAEKQVQTQKTLPSCPVELTRQKCPFIGCRFTCIQKLFPETMVMHLQQANHTQLNFTGIFEFANKLSANEGDSESTVVPLPIQEKCYDAIMDIILEKNVTGFICVECNQGFDLKDKTEMNTHILGCKARFIPNPSGSMTSILDTLVLSPWMCFHCGTTLTKSQMNTHNDVCPKNNPQQPLWTKCTTIKDLLVTCNKLLSQHSYLQTQKKRQCEEENSSSKKRRLEMPCMETPPLSSAFQDKTVNKKGLDIKVTLNNKTSQAAALKTANPQLPSTSIPLTSFSIHRRRNRNNNNSKSVYGNKKPLPSLPPYPAGLGYHFQAQKNVPGNFNFNNRTVNPFLCFGGMQTTALYGSSNRYARPFGTRAYHSSSTSKPATLSVPGSLGKCDVNQNIASASVPSQEVLGTVSSHKNSNSSTPTNWIGPSMKFLESMAQIILVDLDNWPSFFSRLMAPLPDKTFVWGFHAQKTNWYQPRNCMAFDKICQQGCFQLHPQSGNTKDAADFALCMQVCYFRFRIG